MRSFSSNFGFYIELLRHIKTIVFLLFSKQNIDSTSIFCHWINGKDHQSKVQNEGLSIYKKNSFRSYLICIINHNIEGSILVSQQNLTKSPLQCTWISRIWVVYDENFERLMLRIVVKWYYLCQAFEKKQLESNKCIFFQNHVKINLTFLFLLLSVRIFWLP
jgi:hypothetical protein